MRPVIPAPKQQPPRVGARLRNARLLQRLTIAQVADTAGVTKGFLSRLERDEASPSVATLIALCDVLSIEVGSLFSAPERQVVSLDEAPFINMGGSGVTERLITPRGESRVQILWSCAEPGGSGGAEPYTVNTEVETLHVLDGEIVVRFPDEEKHLVAGDSLTFRGHDPHTWHNPGPAPHTVLWILTPAPWSGSSA